MFPVSSGFPLQDPGHGQFAISAVQFQFEAHIHKDFMYLASKAQIKQCIGFTL